MTATVPSCKTSALIASLLWRKAPRRPLPDGWKMPRPIPPQMARRETIIQAHENLVAANPANAIRFKDVLEFLQQKAP